LEMRMWGPSQELMRNNFEDHDGPTTNVITAGAMIALSNTQLSTAALGEQSA
jgi:hypothetical protein